MTEQHSAFIPLPVPDGRQIIEGKEYVSDSRGRLVPVEMIKPQHMLEDQMVREQFGWIFSLAEQIERYRGHLFSDLGEFDALIAEKYGAEKGGVKGNRTYSTVDDCYTISIRVRDVMDFGSELQAAKLLIDECLRGWTEDAAAPLRVIVDGAFNVDKEGLINKAEIFKLLRHNITDAKWLLAMDALRDAIRVTGSRTTPEFKTRSAPGEKQVSISISLAR